MLCSQEKDNENNVIYSGINQQCGNNLDYGENIGHQTTNTPYANNNVM